MFAQVWLRSQPYAPSLQLDTPSYITSTAVSPSGTYMAFGDAEGVISMLTAADEDAILPLNGFEGRPVEWADAVDPLPDIDWKDYTLVIPPC